MGTIHRPPPYQDAAESPRSRQPLRAGGWLASAFAPASAKAATELREIKLNWLPDVVSLCMAQPCRTLCSNGPKAAGKARATTDLLVNSQALCHLRYRGNELMPRDRFERSTRRVEAGRSFL
jgi:hypothetical protein